MNRNRFGLPVGFAIIVAEIFVFPATATAAVGPDLSVTASGSAVSHYMFRGQLRGGPSLQPYLEMYSGDLRLGVSSNFPVKDKEPGQSDPEFDFFGFYRFKFAKDTLTLTPGLTLYTFPKAPTNAGYYRSTIEPSAALTYVISGFRVTPTCCYDLVRRGPTYELNAGYALPLARLGTELDFMATAGTYDFRDFANDATPSVKAWGDYWLVGVSAPVQISAKSTITLGFAYTEGCNAFTKAGSFGKTPNPLAVGRGVASISYAFTF